MVRFAAHPIIQDQVSLCALGASVKVINVGTGVTPQLTTNTSGYFEAPLLIAGTYEVAVARRCHISSYCDVRCHRCAFSARCWSFAVRQGLEPDSPEDVEPAEPELEPQTPRRPGWAELHNIDVDDSEITEYDARTQRLKDDLLEMHARLSASDVSEILWPLLKEGSDARVFERQFGLLAGQVRVNPLDEFALRANNQRAAVECVHWGSFYSLHFLDFRATQYSANGLCFSDTRRRSSAR